MIKTEIHHLYPILVELIKKQINILHQRQKNKTLSDNPIDPYAHALINYENSLEELFEEIIKLFPAQYQKSLSMEKSLCESGFYICITLKPFDVQSLIYFEKISDPSLKFSTIASSSFIRYFLICYKKRNICKLMNQAFE